MKILHTVESYLPALHGMSEVVRQISEGLVQKGHEVWVVTSTDPRRKTNQIRGVNIRAFSVSGKSATGIFGESRAYQKFLLESDADVIVNFAAQQWATDLMLPLLDRIRAKKVFVPTGFSALGDPMFANYFSSMRKWIQKYDACVFLSDDYRDVNFAREIGVRNRVLIPNGAARQEFDSAPDPNFKTKLGIPGGHSLIIHVSGYLSPAKGQMEAIRIFSQSKIFNATLLIVSGEFAKHPLSDLRPAKVIRAFWYLLSGRGAFGFFFRSWIALEKRMAGIRNRAFNRKILTAALSREDTVRAFQAADLLLFPSWIECSPLVLFEAAASRTPFLVTDVGNAREIIAWTQGGEILPGRRLRDSQGSMAASVSAGSKILNRLWGNPRRRRAMAQFAHQAWRKHFTWEKITGLYESLYQDLICGRKPKARPVGLPRYQRQAERLTFVRPEAKPNESYHRITKESLILLVAQVLTVVGSLVGMRVLTHFLEPAEMGRIALGLTMGTFANQLLFGPLASGAARFFMPAKEKEDLRRYLETLGWFFCRAVGVMGLVTLISVLVIWRLDPPGMMLVLLAATLAVFSGGNWLVQSVWNAARCRGFTAASQVLEQWFKYGLAFLLLLCLPTTAETVLTGHNLAAASIFAVFAILLFRAFGQREQPPSNRNIWRAEIFRYSLPFAMWGMFTWAQAASDRWALAWRAGPADVGLYSVAYQIGYAPMAMLTGLALQVASPIIFEKAGQAISRRRLKITRRQIFRLTYVSLGVTLGAFLLLAVLGKMVMNLVVAHEYRGGAYLLPWLALSGGLFSAGQILSLEFLANLQSSSLARIKIVTAMAGTVLNLAGAFWLGTVGIVAAGVIFSLGYFLWIAQACLSKKLKYV